MRNNKSFGFQLRSVAPVLMRLYAPALLLLFGIGLARVIGEVNIGKIARDPAQTVGYNPLLGMLPNIGILLWSSSAAICFFCSTILWHDTERRNAAVLLLAAGVTTSVLLMDDLFLLHDFFVPTYLHVPEKAVHCAYGIIVFAFLIAFWRMIRRTEYVILAFALVFLASSVFFDIIPVYVPGHFLFEEGFKLLGILSWSCYFIRVCLQYMEPSMWTQQQQSGL